jgi:hypothetical protein
MSAITGQAASCTIFSTRWSSDVLYLYLARDHFVPERGDDRRDEGQAILALVRDQNAQVLGFAVAHLCLPASVPLRAIELSCRTPKRLPVCSVRS